MQDAEEESLSLVIVSCGRKLALNIEVVFYSLGIKGKLGAL